MGSWRALYRAAPFLMTLSCARLLGPPSFASSPRANESSSGSTNLLRVATFNISGASNLGRLAELVAASSEMRNVDVLMVQELASGVSTQDLENLGAGLGLPFAHTAERHVGAPSLALSSRFPLRDLEILYLPRFDLGYRSRRRIAIAGSVELGGESVRLYNVHLDTRIRLSDRIRQLAPVVEGALSSPRAIVGGDVNTIRSVPV
ncbi:MAG: endonuclease/exonuclease/phosphatase family protein, partial [Vicinamibacteria bacterium]